MEILSPIETYIITCNHPDHKLPLCAAMVLRPLLETELVRFAPYYIESHLKVFHADDPNAYQYISICTYPKKEIVTTLTLALSNPKS